MIRQPTALLAGLAAGGFLGLVYFIANPAVLILGLAWGVALARRPSLVAVASTLFGFGAAWMLAIGQITWSCAHDPTCTVPGFTVVWLAIGATVAVLGASLGLSARDRGSSASGS